MSLIVSKQGWCHFEALECIFHLNLKKFHSGNQLTHNQQNTAFPSLWSTLYNGQLFHLATEIGGQFYHAK